MLRMDIIRKKGKFARKEKGRRAACSVFRRFDEGPVLGHGRDVESCCCSGDGGETLQNSICS